jgi:hypothetical protein
MRIEEQVNITDSKVRGVVVVTKKDGTIVLKKENMIVQNGRKFIRDKFAAAGIAGQSAFSTLLSNYSLSHLSFGNSPKATEYTMTALDGEIDDTARVPLSASNTVIEANSMFIRFRAELSRVDKTTGYAATEVGLFITSTGDTTGLLFSRAVFDPITIGPGETYEIDYYIYF